MSRFEDVEQFVKDHRGCGSITPITSSPGRGGYLLIMACSCGQQFQRWVTDAETEAGAPTPTARRPAAPIDLSTASSGNESLESVMQQALEAMEPKTVAPPKAAAPSAPPPPPAAPPPPPRPAPPAPPPVMPPQPPRPASPPPPAPVSAPPPKPAAPPTPPPPAVRQSPPPAARPARREMDGPTPDRTSLEDALRRTLDALGETDLTVTTFIPEGPATRVIDLDAEASAKTAPRPVASKPGERPDKVQLQDALLATLSALEAERSVTGEKGKASRPRRKLSVAGALVICLLLLAAVGVGYGLSVLGQRPAEVTATPSRPVARLRVAENERASVTQALSALRDLQSVSRADIPYRQYFSRVSFAKNDVVTALSSVKDLDLKNALGEALTLHVYAAAAWQAKTLNEREKWETIGDDPAAEICPGTKRLLTVSEEPANMSRAQWRGIAIAAGLPLLWDCAAERLADIERGLNDKNR
jgi:hypothetical protein